MDGKIVFHWALREGHLGLVGALNHAVIAERDYAFVLVDDYTAHFGGWILGLGCHGFGDFHKIFVPILLCATHITPIIACFEGGGLIFEMSCAYNASKIKKE